MPQETLTFPPLYCIIGAYRLMHDPTLWKPMWSKCSRAAKHAAIVGLVWTVLTWPFQSWFVHHFMSASASVTGLRALHASVVHSVHELDEAPWGLASVVPSLQTLATLMFVGAQVHAIIQFWLRSKLVQCSRSAYVQTVKSRGKPSDWWSEYVEEFSNPPTHKALNDANKHAWYLRLASPIVRFFLLKLCLMPVDLVPFFGMVLGAAIRSLSYGRLLHKPFFDAKRMSPFQIQLWITERQSAYRSFGFVAALMERIPLVGLVFCISNHIGAAMWAHDLEKRQQRIRTSLSELEQYKNKPTLKQLYNTVQQSDDSSQVSATATEPSFNGEGLAVLRYSNGAAVFTHLSFTFPLKLICPHLSSRNATLSLNHPPVHNVALKAISVLYIVGYGGGLVSGDSVDLDVDVGPNCALVVLTQGSTNVFKTRHSRPTAAVTTPNFTHPHLDSSTPHTHPASTRQTFRFLIRNNATLVLLPDPVTCFANSKYDQVQRFDLRTRDASLIVLDWITPGRVAVPPSNPNPPNHPLNHLDSHLDSHPPPTESHHMQNVDTVQNKRSPEIWSFHQYRSRNEIRINQHPIARDMLLLSQSQPQPHPTSASNPSELARRNHPYACYATLLLAGPSSHHIVHRLEHEFHTVQQRASTVVDDLVWSISLVDDEFPHHGGCRVVRIAACDSQTVRRWLHARLDALKSVVGVDLYRQALG